jgi:hypothetical protein
LLSSFLPATREDCTRFANLILDLQRSNLEGNPSLREASLSELARLKPVGSNRTTLEIQWADGLSLFEYLPSPTAAKSLAQMSVVVKALIAQTLDTFLAERFAKDQRSEERLRVLARALVTDSMEGLATDGVRPRWIRSHSTFVAYVTEQFAMVSCQPVG